ncbi:MAG: histidine kinase [Ignavibacteriales bacterium]|nr:histidine kinase [Ignavibacteriales bacterium]
MFDAATVDVVIRDLEDGRTTLHSCSTKPDGDDHGAAIQTTGARRSPPGGVVLRVAPHRLARRAGPRRRHLRRHRPDGRLVSRAPRLRAPAPAVPRQPRLPVNHGRRFRAGRPVAGAGLPVRRAGRRRPRGAPDVLRVARGADHTGALERPAAPAPAGPSGRRGAARVARDLHDGAIQALIGIDMETEALRRRAEREAPTLAPRTRAPPRSAAPRGRRPQGAHPGAAARRPGCRRAASGRAHRACPAVSTRYRGGRAHGLQRCGRDHAHRRRHRIRADHPGGPRQRAKAQRSRPRARGVVRGGGPLDARRRRRREGFDFEGRLSDTELALRRAGPAIIMERAHAVGGRVAVASDSGEGRPRRGASSRQGPMADPSRAVTIVIADDHPLFRDGLRKLLESEPGFRVVGVAADGRGRGPPRARAGARRAPARSLDAPHRRPGGAWRDGQRTDPGHHPDRGHPAGGGAPRPPVGRAWRRAQGGSHPSADRRHPARRGREVDRR